MITKTQKHFNYLVKLPQVYVRKRPLLANLITRVCVYVCMYVMYRNLKNSTEVLMIVKIYP